MKEKNETRPVTALCPGPGMKKQGIGRQGGIFCFLLIYMFHKLTSFPILLKMFHLLDSTDGWVIADACTSAYSVASKCLQL